MPLECHEFKKKFPTLFMTVLDVFENSYSSYFRIIILKIKMCDQEFRTLRIDPRYPFQNQTRFVIVFISC